MFGGSWQSAADIEELADSQVGDVGDGAGLEPACLHRQVRGVREDLQHPRRLSPVGGEIVFTAEQEVIDPGDAGRGRVELGLPDAQPVPEPADVLGLGEPGLYLLYGGLGEVEQPVPDHPLVNPVGRELQPQFLHRRPRPLHNGRHQCAALRPVVHASVRE